MSIHLTNLPVALLQSPADQNGWFDIAALVVLGIFAILGLFKGFAWQLGRLLMLASAYVVALLLGPKVSPRIAGWMDPATAPELPLHIAHLALFVGVVTLLGLLAWLLHRFMPPKPITRASRMLGALTGLAAGCLVVLAGLTAIAMFLPDRGVARAAETSHSAGVGRQALTYAERFLPDQWSAGARQWRVLLEPVTQASTNPPTGTSDGKPVEGTFRESDGATPREAPPKSVAPGKR
ncbi:MAG: CvpA family protein [Planctomycetota bacterium]